MMISLVCRLLLALGLGYKFEIHDIDSLFSDIFYLSYGMCSL